MAIQAPLVQVLDPIQRLNTGDLWWGMAWRHVAQTLQQERTSHSVIACFRQNLRPDRDPQRLFDGRTEGWIGMRRALEAFLTNRSHPPSDSWEEVREGRDRS